MALSVASTIMPPTIRGYFAKLAYQCRIPYRIRILRGYVRIRIPDVSDNLAISK